MWRSKTCEGDAPLDECATCKSRASDASAAASADSTADAASLTLEVATLRSVSMRCV
jgi:hypothetical protein